MFKLLEKKSTPNNIKIGLIAVLAFNLVLFPLFPQIIKGIEVPLDSMLDLNFGYTTKEAYLQLSNLGEDGRIAYFWLVAIIDMLYPLVYGFVYAIVVVRQLKQNCLEKLRWLVWFPVLMAFSDVLENVGTLLQLVSFPQQNELASAFGSFFNQAKWTFAGITFLVVLGLFVYSKKRKQKVRLSK